MRNMIRIIHVISHDIHVSFTETNIIEIDIISQSYSQSYL